ncbi:MAG: 50S ribosomal protein L28 [Candidatus Magasanikbacteria bacterium GW2011_GWA2_37_8]|uniref:50S ribosomal protein L28 n=1 Tax=Candidatus Magasanikbacteria bacterium GW2011_GWA2_37_8 TaxID=1619036 RepID=A0A0G0KJT0_9BACT|nr:MAG: 50S ribosomal protein L28 [Candidatus Magasanikbacteria bacterium GW2011_GWA2_37_8]
MSKMCAICGKTSARANHVSHSKRHVPRRQHPNLQLLTVAEEKIKACSTCRRTLKKKTK